MSIGTRIGSLLLLSGLVLLGLVGMAAAPARAETAGWTDPPARTATPDDTPVAAKPAPAPAAPDPGEAAAAPTTAEAAPAPRRDAAARRHAKAAAPARRRTAAAPRSRPVPAERAMPSAPRRIATHRAGRRPGFARRDDGGAQAVARAVPVPATRRAGWEGLLGDDRARRIARAREAGYLVMRSREVVYPDGRVVRTLHPLGPMEGEFD